MVVYLIFISDTHFPVLQGSNGTKYYFRVNPVPTFQNRDGTARNDFTDNGNGTTRNGNGQAEDQTCPPGNGLPLQLVDEKFVEKV